ncbi:MAG TPA: hypothetical protein VLL97_13750 [Acidobacteriota bacterium]|nr:hypothetical protein [Acidobacteriota bacterium]
MRYNEFRDQLQEALYRAGILSGAAGGPVETIDIGGMTRRWEILAWHKSLRKAEPFHICMKIAFAWEPFDSARTFTCEENLIENLLGSSRKSFKTERRWTRVNLTLSATLPYGSTTPLPDPQVLGSWTRSVGEKLDEYMEEFSKRQGKVASVMGAREDIRIEVNCAPDGSLCLEGLSVAGFRIVWLPRVWDDPDRQQAEKGIGDQLDRLAGLFESALERWTGSVAELVKWMRYAPPPSEASHLEPQIRIDDEEDNGPGTVH